MKANTISGQRQYAFVSQFNYIREAGTEGEEKAACRIEKELSQIRKQVPQILSLVGITDKADKYPDELSAGEQQRVAIARAIINNPMVLIADEPTGNLDPVTASEIMDLLEQINMRGTTIVMVTHAKDIVDRMKKRVIAIEKGRVIHDQEGSYIFKEEVEGLE